MPDPAGPARSARVPASQHFQVGDAQIWTSVREQTADAGSYPLGGGPCKARTPHAYEACRGYSSRDPSRNASIQKPLQVASMAISATYSRSVPTTASQNTGLTGHSHHTPFSGRPTNPDGARSSTASFLPRPSLAHPTNMHLYRQRHPASSSESEF